ncbi:hypothetical protein SAMN05661008_01508 [Alkalithermobacter thermoalcaliphilus JW-YL-7 = DSM 7308]|uniref:DUF5651 domain-containing protein n=1 Tax=Alkalithermobacter thermoalcaliphilus JW-YL-7 = DSM 7308 TaxID=1121328 RepID=A0A150FR04_CLOPD|nr:hypothetical protein JWYL7_1107 [[Clostridium] paradoxum JW-YL-7 = DSM 7308]SHL12945.1 hypothetical protein SAMN05661008_01508 [[Clostridium] paradoxum JW-YL-7 = DSM 7308]
MKNYLNREEANDFMLTGVLLDTVSRIRTEWSGRNFITKEEHKNLKLAETYLTKYYKAVLERLGKKEAEKVFKRLGDFELKIMDRYMLNRLRGQWENELQVAHLKREEFEDWCEQIMHIKCKNCSLDYNNCNLYDVFEENLVPDSGYNLHNCRFAYKEMKVKKKKKK